jgi:3-oxoacyl-[acyl-carrier-protein] synthase-1
VNATLRRFGASPVSPLLVCHTGAINGLAFDPWQLWAFLRAELAAFAETPFRCANGTRATMAHVQTLHPQSVGVERLVPLGTQLLHGVTELLARAPADLRLALILCVPARMADGGGGTFPQQRRILERELTSWLAAAQSARGAPDPVVRTLALGHASMAYALEEIAPVLDRGVEAAIVLGLDTGYDPTWVEHLLATERLFDGERLDTAIAGEGGALALLATPDAVARCRWPVLASVSASATAREAATLDNDVPMMGLALSRCAVAATDALEAQRRPLDWWITDMTSEPYRVQEFQLVWPRASARRMTADGTLHFLASQLGDLGAAAMPTALCLAVEGFARGAPVADTCLITGSSAGGERGVVLVERAR